MANLACYSRSLRQRAQAPIVPHWRKEDAAAAVGIRSAVLANVWWLAVRYLAPAMIVIVLLRATGWL